MIQTGIAMRSAGLLSLLLLFGAVLVLKSAPAALSSEAALFRLNPELPQQLDGSVALLNSLMAAPNNAIPDAVLNRTKCVIIAPAPANRGLATCRYSPDSDRWSQPVPVVVAGQQQPAQDRLLLLLSARAVDALKAARLDLKTDVKAAPGIMERQSPLADGTDLNHDVLSYAQRGEVFAGSNPPDAVALEVPVSKWPFGAGFTPAAMLDRAAPPSQPISAFENAVTSYFNSITPDGIVIHHSATLPDGVLPASLDDLDSFHQKRGFSILCFDRVYHVAYHYTIFPDGRVVAGRPERCQGAHARGYNSFLGISVVGDFSSEDNPHGAKGLTSPTEPQMQSLIALTRSLRDHYHIPLQHIVRHSDVGVTRCPGDRFPFQQLLSALERP